jgi:hypothetical protein
MTLRGPFSLASLGLVGLVSVAACNKDGSTEGSNSGSESSAPSTTTGEGGSTTTSPSTPTTEGGTTADETGLVLTTAEADPTLPTPDQGGSGGQCNLFLQDCNAGEKCTAWNMDGGIFPNGTKCVPQTGDKLPGDSCQLEGSFGEGVDDCAAGALCLDIDNSGQATCVAYCSGDMQNPECPGSEDKCAFLFEPTVPLCFPACDPLTQNCADDEACVPNIAALGSEYFVCMPLVFEEIPGQYGDACYAISGCDRGYQCIFAENVPNCAGDMYCCSTWCDITMPDTCKAFDPTIDCVPWYEEGQETPGYENVGICGIML